MGGPLTLDQFMWGSDFPHSVGTLPNSHQYLDDAFSGLEDV